MIDGYVDKLKCRACELVAHTFVYKGDTDMATAGLASLSSIVVNELVLFEMTGDEWSDYANQTAAKARISTLLRRDDLRTVKFLRAEKNNSVGKGRSFKEFRKQYQPPNLIFTCPNCETGEAISFQKQTITEYKNDGGSIVCLNDLLIQEV